MLRILNLLIKYKVLFVILPVLIIFLGISPSIDAINCVHTWGQAIRSNSVRFVNRTTFCLSGYRRSMLRLYNGIQSRYGLVATSLLLAYASLGFPLLSLMRCKLLFFLINVMIQKEDLWIKIIICHFGACLKDPGKGWGLPYMRVGI